MSGMIPSVILALDVEDKNRARSVLQATGDRLEWVKIGLQTYLRDGPDFVREVADSGKKVFLDLKLHDIPNTMCKALESLASLPAPLSFSPFNDRWEFYWILSDPGGSCQVHFLKNNDVDALYLVHGSKIVTNKSASAFLALAIFFY